jgi:ABC-type cobalt transport system substrate-binding protein
MMMMMMMMMMTVTTMMMTTTRTWQWWGNDNDDDDYFIDKCSSDPLSFQALLHPFSGWIRSCAVTFSWMVISMHTYCSKQWNINMRIGRSYHMLYLQLLNGIDTLIHCCIELKNSVNHC